MDLTQQTNMEIWKDVVGYEGLYQISSYGNVSNNYGLMTPQKNRFGYLKIRLSKNNQRKGFFIHRLVGIAFIDNHNNKRCINHIDGDKGNNNLQNLEWATHSENEKHAYKIGLQPNKGGEKNGRAKINKDDVIAIRNSTQSNSELGRVYNLSPTTISYIRKRKLWRHVV